MRGSSFARLHLCRGQVYSEPRRKHPRRESIHLTTEAFNTFKNSISKIATCLGETDRAGRRGAVQEGGWRGGGGGSGVSEQEAQLLIYVRQWMKASERQAEKEQP